MNTSVLSRLVGSLVAAFALATAGCSGGDSRASFDGQSDAGPGTDGTGDAATGAPDGSTVPPDPTTPGCAQSAYAEALPTSASLSGLTYTQSTAQKYILDALNLRYPIGNFVLQGGISSPLTAQQGNCVDRFLQDKSSGPSVLRQAQTVVHECGHFFDLGDSQGSASAYHLRPDLKFSCSQGDTTSRGGTTFARSLLRTDAFYAKRKACGGASTPGCDMYADIYLDGSPTDSTFQSGDQGYGSVLEEATQYVNSLATSLAFRDAYQGQSSSQRDGILTFLWYIERYMKMAREQYPTAYSTLSTDPCWRQATLSVWDRGSFFLNATKGMAELGIDDSAIEALVNDATLLAEIDTLRKLECK